jgi:hypothetical protein
MKARSFMKLLIQNCMGIAVVVLALVCSAEESGTISLGGARIAIPPPAGFKDVISNPDAQWLTRAYRSSVYDVAALYVPVDMQIEKVEAGREVRRHMVLLRPRNPELQRPKSYLEFRNDETLRQQIASRGNLQVIRDAGTSAVTLAVTSSSPADVVVATSSILVRERVVTVHVVSVLHSDEDRTWVIETTMRWIESINSANQ